MHISFYAASGFTIILVTISTFFFSYLPGIRRFGWGPYAGLVLWTVFGMLMLARHFHVIEMIRYAFHFR
jgi:hypothetical protein